MTRAIVLLAAGALAALPLVAWARRRSPRHQVAIYAAGLAVAALVYLVFALTLGGDQRFSAAAAGREAVGLLAYGVIALLAARSRPWLAALGWAAHAGWDGMHLAAATAYVPAWYPWACIGLDVALALYLAAALRRRPVS